MAGGGVPAGWYPEPDGSRRGSLRYWDGRAWTEHTAPGSTMGVPGPPSSVRADGNLGSTPGRRPRDWSGAARMLVGAVLAGVASVLIWYLTMHRFALRGEWLGSGLSLALGSALGLLVGVWSSDRGQKSGWLAALLAGTTASMAIVLATDAAMIGTLVTTDDLTTMARMAPLSAFIAAFTAALSGRSNWRRPKGWAGVLMFCLVPLALGCVAYLRMPADQDRSMAIENATRPADSTATTPLPHMDPEKVTACVAERAAVERAVAAANQTTGMTPTDIDPSLAGNTYRTWGRMADGTYVGTFRSPWVC